MLLKCSDVGSSYYIILSWLLVAFSGEMHAVLLLLQQI